MKISHLRASNWLAAYSAQVTIGSEDLKANHAIQQIFEFPQEGDKYRLLVRPCCVPQTIARPILMSRTATNSHPILMPRTATNALLSVSRAPRPSRVLRTRSYSVQVVLPAVLKLTALPARRQATHAILQKFSVRRF